MFTTLESSIPIKDRRTFNITSLKPLVIVDTNLLIDAFKDELIKRGSPYGLGNLDWSLKDVSMGIKEAKRRGIDQTYLPESVMRSFQIELATFLPQRGFSTANTKTKAYGHP